MPARIHRDRDDASSRGGRSFELIDFVERQRQGLLDNHVFTGAEGRYRYLSMKLRRRRNHDGIDLFRCD